MRILSSLFKEVLEITRDSRLAEPNFGLRGLPTHEGQGHHQEKTKTRQPSKALVPRPLDQFASGDPDDHADFLMCSR
jgi:hypothetical protein